MRSNEILVITTGGTIEKTYDEFEGTLRNRDHGIEKEILPKLRFPHCKITVSRLLSKDSLGLTDYDRTLILKNVEHHLEKQIPIVILHGTDTMVKTAKLFFQSFKELKVPIIFTGAMRPMGFENSDALQNLTEALMVARVLTGGVYITFHNELFKLPNVKKDYQKRTFVHDL